MDLTDQKDDAGVLPRAADVRDLGNHPLASRAAANAGVVSRLNNASTSDGSNELRESIHQVSSSIKPAARRSTLPGAVPLRLGFPCPPIYQERANCQRAGWKS